MGDSSENRCQFKANTGIEVIFVWWLHPFHLVTESSIFRQVVICHSFYVCLHAQDDLDFYIQNMCKSNNVQVCVYVLGVFLWNLKYRDVKLLKYFFLAELMLNSILTTKSTCKIMKHSYKRSAYRFYAQKSLSFYCLSRPMYHDPAFPLQKIDLLC